MGSGAGPGYLSLKIHSHPLHPRHSPIPLSPCSPTLKLPPAPRTQSSHSRGYIRSPFHFLPPHLIHHSPRLSQTQHPPSPCWHKLGPAKGNSPHHFQVPHQIPHNIRLPHLVPQLQTLIPTKAPIPPKLRLRIATGCVKMSSIGHLHAEASVLPVQDYLSLLSASFLACCLGPSHPSFHTVTAPSGTRQMKYTLQSRFHSTVAPYLSNGSLPPDQYTDTLQLLHTSAVQNYISSRPPNRVLQEPPPPVSEDERALPRPFRTTLAQLRSGFCPALKTYLERVGRSPDGLCPSCRGAPHTTAHLFSCPSHPTSLTVRDLWERPVAVAEFLPSLPFPFILPALQRPPPEPPPLGQ